MKRLLPALVALTTIGILLPAASVGSHEPDVTVRIVARQLADGRVEFGLRQQQADGTYSSEILPRVRFFPTSAEVGRWLRSSPVDLSGIDAPTTVTTRAATYTHSHCQRVRNDGGCDRRYNPPRCPEHAHLESERNRHRNDHC